MWLYGIVAYCLIVINLFIQCCIYTCDSRLFIVLMYRLTFHCTFFFVKTSKVLKLPKCYIFRVNDITISMNYNTILSNPTLVSHMKIK